MRATKRENDRPHDLKYWLKDFLISVPIVAFAGYIFGEYSGKPISFFQSVVEFSLSFTVFRAILDKIGKKWENKNFLFRKIF